VGKKKILLKSFLKIDKKLKKFKLPHPHVTCMLAKWQHPAFGSY
jgi:hypothetical protein